MSRAFWLVLLAGLWLPQSAYGDRGLGLFCLLWCVFIPLLGWALAFVSARGQAGAFQVAKLRA